MYHLVTAEHHDRVLGIEAGKALLTQLRQQNVVEI